MLASRPSAPAAPTTLSSVKRPTNRASPRASAAGSHDAARGAGRVLERLSGAALGGRRRRGTARGSGGGPGARVRSGADGDRRSGVWHGRDPVHAPDCITGPVFGRAAAERAHSCGGPTHRSRLRAAQPRSEALAPARRIRGMEASADRAVRRGPARAGIRSVYAAGLGTYRRRFLPDRVRGDGRVRPHRPRGHAGHRGRQGRRRERRCAERRHLGLGHRGQRGGDDAQPRLLRRRHRPHRGRGSAGARRCPAPAHLARTPRRCASSSPPPSPRC